MTKKKKTPKKVRNPFTIPAKQRKSKMIKSKKKKWKLEDETK